VKKLILISIITFILGLGAGLFFIEDRSDAESPLTKMGIGGEFVLHAGNRDVRLSDFSGKVVLMFFGYTSCPDICPTTLLTLAAVLNKLSDDESDEVQVLFVSVDPGRDSSEKLSDYTEYYHQDILGLSGSKQEIDTVVKQYASAYRKIESDSAVGYLVEHSSAIYLIDKDGQLIKLLPGDLDVDAIVTAIRHQM